MKEKPSEISKQQNKRSSGKVSGAEGTLGQWVNGKWARSLVAALVLLLLLLAAAFYVPRGEDHNHYAQHATHTEGSREGTGACSIKGDCEITCEYINDGTTEPGHVAAEFVLSEQSRCGDLLEVASLTIQGCTFPNSKLSVGWLPLKKTIKHLTIFDSTFSNIEDEAFSNLRFTTEARLTIDTFTISWLSKGMLKGIKGLKALELRVNDYLESIEEDFLEHVAPSLKSLQIQNMDAISNQTIKNITGASTHLANVEELVIRYNLYIGHLGPNIFSRMPMLKSLDLTRNGLYSIDTNAFLSIRDSVELIYLLGNYLSTLTQGTFDGLTLALQRKMWFRIYLRDNPWNCDCSLLWLQDMMRENNETFKDDPLCDTPSSLYLTPLKDAAICVNGTTPSPTTPSPTPTTTTEVSTESTVSSSTEQSTTDGSTTDQSTTDSSNTEQSTTDSSTTDQSTTDSSNTEQSTTDSSNTEQTTTDGSTIDQSTTDSSTTEQTTTENPNNDTITVECIDLAEPRNLPQTRKLSIDESRPNENRSAPAHDMPAKRRLMSSMSFARVDFKVNEVADGAVVAYVGNAIGTLIRIEGDDKLNYSCYSNATGNVTYRDVRPSSSYTFCLATEESREFNCRALTTLPVPGERTWLAREDRVVVIAVGAVVVLACGLVCSAIVFVTVRRHPVLLKGSKRVVVVRRRTVDVVVLPKQRKHTLAESYRSREQQVYTTDSSYRRTYAHSVSQVSTVTGRSSSTSYVSAVEPTQGQLMQWRIERMKEKVRRLFNESSFTESSSDEPPPLPPHPLRRQSSTSYIHRQSNETGYSSFSE